MRLILVLFGLIVAASESLAQTKEQDDRPVSRFRSGRWWAIAGQHDGRPLSEAELRKIDFHTSGTDSSILGYFSLESAKALPFFGEMGQITFNGASQCEWLTKRTIGHGTMFGLWELAQSGEQFRLCWKPGSEKSRPETFDAPKGSGCVTLTFAFEETMLAIRAKMSGTWLALETQTGGKPAKTPEPMVAKFEFASETDYRLRPGRARWTLTQGSWVFYDGEIHFDVAPWPLAFNHVIVAGPGKGKKVRGIFRIREHLRDLGLERKRSQTLALAWNLPEGDRPAGFETKAGSSAWAGEFRKPGDAPELPSQILATLQGNWVAIQVTIDGKPGDHFVLDGHDLNIKGKEWSTRDWKGTVALNTKTLPFQIEVVPAGGDKKNQRNGIYKRNGNILTVCFGPPGGPAPVTLDGPSSEGLRIVYVWLNDGSRIAGSAIPSQIKGKWVGTPASPATSFVPSVSLSNRSMVIQVNEKITLSGIPRFHRSEFDLVLTEESERGKVIHGLFRQEGDQLTLGWSAPDQPRPASLDHAAGATILQLHVSEETLQARADRARRMRIGLYILGGLAVLMIPVVLLYRMGVNRGWISPIRWPTGGEKSCGRCGRQVSMSSRAGQNCPYCGARWSTEHHRSR